MELIVEIVVYSWIVTFAFCLAVSFGYPILKDYYDNSFEIFIPFYNLLRLCSIVGYSELLGFLFLIPFINIFAIYLIGFGLSKKIETYKIFKIGYIILPILFIPISSYIKYNKNDNKKIVEQDVEKFEIDNSEEKLYSDEVDESIFKIRSRQKEYSTDEKKPYKAKKVMVNQKFIDSDPAKRETVEKIEKEKN